MKKTAIGISGGILILAFLLFFQHINRRFGILSHPNLALMVENARPLILAIEKYKSVNGRYPTSVDVLDSQDKILADSNGWHYAGFDDGYLLRKFTGHLRDTIWFSNQGFDDHQFRWYLDDESGDPVKLLEFNSQK